MSQTAGIRVLVVEDEPRMRELLLRALASWQYDAAGAPTAEEALRMLEQERYQIVLLDLNLPAMSGMEFLERLRERGAETQVIILTGFGSLETARRAIHLEVVEFLTKPAHLGEVEMAVDRARRKVKRELPPLDAGVEDADPPPRKLEEIERDHILAALARNHGNRTATAAEVGISLRTLYYRLQTYQAQGYTVNDEED
jgi:DNA-binding NtrC family response regulator